MSGDTEADRLLSEVAESVTQAFVTMNKVVVEEPYGFDDFNDQGHARIRRVHAALLELRDETKVWR